MNDQNEQDLKNNKFIAGMIKRMQEQDNQIKSLQKMTNWMASIPNNLLQDFINQVDLVARETISKVQGMENVRDMVAHEVDKYASAQPQVQSRPPKLFRTIHQTTVVDEFDRHLCDYCMNTLENNTHCFEINVCGRGCGVKFVAEIENIFRNSRKKS